MLASLYIELIIRLPDNMPVLVIGYVEDGRADDDAEVYFTRKRYDPCLYEFPREFTGAEWECISEQLEQEARNRTVR